jgi:hypothetical protein
MLARANRLGGGGGFDDDEEPAAVGVSMMLLSAQEAPSLVLRNIAATYRQVPDMYIRCATLEDYPYLSPFPNYLTSLPMSHLARTVWW